MVSNKKAEGWNSPENKKVLQSLIKTFGRFKKIEIIGWNGEIRYFKVSSKRIITKGIKAKELLSNKYGKEITKKEFKKEV